MPWQFIQQWSRHLTKIQKCQPAQGTIGQSRETPKSAVFILWSSWMSVEHSNTINLRSVETFHSGLWNYSQAAIASILSACLHSNLPPYDWLSHLWPHWASFQFLADHIVQKYSIYFSVTAITIPSVPKLVISLPWSSQPLGLACGLKVRQVIIPFRKPLSRDLWHLAMTHKHSCDPPHLQTFVI